ncbi:hypothetical protein PAMP_006666 [Pampus punctatissimus]
MSGTQSTLTDRTPSILNKDPADKKPNNDKSSVSLKHEFDPTAGSYVALTVLGRPPGLPQVPLEDEEKEEGVEVSPASSLSVPHSPALPGGEQRSSMSCSPQEHIASPLPDRGENKIMYSQKVDILRKMLTKEQQALQAKEEDYSRNARPKLLKEIQEEKKHISLLQEQLSKALQDSSAQCIVGSPPYLLHPQIIGAEDDYFDCQQEQINGQCSCFQSLDLLKSRPAHLAVFLHHVVSQFDPTPLLCFLYADMHKQTSSKESRRFFIEFHSLFMDRAANLKVPVPETISAETEEEKCQNMQYVILTYMKHLGVKVKEPRGLEHKRARINFLPKIKKSIKPEKEVEEKVKKPRFPNILVPPRRQTKVDSTSVGKAVELNKQRSPKLLSQPAFSIPEQSDSSASNSGRIRGNLLSEGSDTGAHVSSSTTTSPTHSSPTGQASDTSGQDSDCNVSPFSIQPRPGEGLQSADHQDGVSSPTSTQFDFIPSNLEQLQEEDQETFSRMEVQCAASSADVHSEDDQGGEVECEEDPLNWQSLVSRGVLASLTPLEIKRQEVINGESPTVSITEQMIAIRKRSETSVIGQIGDDLLAWFSGEEEEKIRRAVGTFCSNQPSALELIKTRKKKDQRFTLFMQEAESNRLCRRLQLKDIIPVEMQRVTKYPLLLDNIAKCTEDGEEKEKVKKAGECCKKILNQVNQAVKEAENKQRLEEYQRRLDLSSLKQTSENPVVLELKNLDLTKRKMVHEGPLSWKVNKDKTIELYTILLEDILVLLQKQDERLVLKFHGKNLASAADTKHIFSPIIKLNTVLVRPVATDNKSFFVLSMSENGPQIYELTAQTVSDQRTWQHLITQRADAMKAKPHNSDAPAAPSDAERDAIEIINCGMPKPSKDANGTASGSIHTSDIQAPPTSLNPFDGMKSEDEEEEQAEADRQEERDDEVDEEELEAFLDGQLADRLPFLQEGSRQGIAFENQEHNAFGIPASKAEDALRTLVMLKQVLFNHMISREEEEEKEENKMSASLPGSPEGPSAPCDKSKASAQKDILSSGQTGLSETPECNGGFVVLDFGGGEESSTDDDGGVGGDAGIDMRKLLSSSSQTGGGGPNLSRQLMTHLRLLQANLQYLKEVEVKYNELRQTLPDAATDWDDNNDGIQ